MNVEAQAPFQRGNSAEVNVLLAFPGAPVRILPLPIPQHYQLLHHLHHRCVTQSTCLFLFLHGLVIFSSSRPCLGAVPRRLAPDRVPQQHGGREALAEGDDLRLPGRPLRRPRQPTQVFRGRVRSDHGGANLLQLRYGRLLHGE